MPGLSKFVVELCLHVLGNIRVVRRSKALQSLDHGDHSRLCHFWVHVVSLDPDLAVGCTAVDFESVAVITGDDDSLGAV